MFVDIAYAQSAQSGGGGSPWFSQLFLFLPLILIFYFLIFRPQQKQRKEVQEMLSNLKIDEGVVVQNVFLQSQPEQDLAGSMLLMSRKDERETFQLRNGAVIFSELKEMQAECIELRAGRVALRSIRCTRALAHKPHPNQQEQQVAASRQHVGL